MVRCTYITRCVFYHLRAGSAVQIFFGRTVHLVSVQRAVAVGAEPSPEQCEAYACKNAVYVDGGRNIFGGGETIATTQLYKT